MKKTALLALVAVAVSTPSMARTHHRHHHLYRKMHEQGVTTKEKPAVSHAHVTCDMVRAYVAQVGLEQAKTMALSAGMTPTEARRAARCLEKKV